MEAAFLEIKLKKRVYINLTKVMVELVIMSQEDYEHFCAELTGGVYGCVDAALLYLVCFC